MCLLPVGTLVAQAEQTGEGGRATNEATKQSAAAREKKPTARSRTPAKSFKPSERIRADSAVSFPVDI